MRKLTHWLLILLMLLQFGCRQVDEQQISFYHWKSNAEPSKLLHDINQRLTRKPKVYMHYFDVDVIDELHTSKEKVFPIYQLKDVDSSYRQFEVIPVVFITNRVLQSAVSISELSTKIIRLTHQISETHFEKKHTIIHLDCDWTLSTRERYFELLRKIGKLIKVVPTIRLHQIKYKEKTGIPPSEEGVLMLYNVGDLRNPESNSILTSEIVKNYVNDQSSYPFKLHLALPIFSQSVIKNNDNDLRLLNSVNREGLSSASNYFEEKSKNVFRVKKDTLYHGYYLSEGFEIKLEELDVKEVIQSYQVIKQADFDLGEVIFYHLSDEVMTKENLGIVIDEL